MIKENKKDGGLNLEWLMINVSFCYGIGQFLISQETEKRLVTKFLFRRQPLWPIEVTG